jgi:A/G-specific adenine glycosylase
VSLTGKTLGAFRRRLLTWFGHQKRDLPWRRTKDPYLVWISEIMLQQTRVAAAIPYYEKFLARFPDVHALAEAPEDDVLREWSGLGYYRRARNLQLAAREIAAKRGGRFPREYAEILALPGIGGYSAAAIASIAFGAPHAVLDGNVARVLARVEALRGDLREPRRWRKLQALADKLLDRKRPGDWNQAMMELGATVCTPRAPMCLLCPISQSCRARALGLEETLPARREKPQAVKLDLAATVFLDLSGRTLLLPPRGVKDTNGLPRAIFSGMWQFPVVLVRGKDRTDLLAHLQKELGGRGAAPLELLLLKKVRQAVTNHDVNVTPCLVKVKRLPRAHGARAVLLSAPIPVPVSNLTRKIALAASPRGN